MKRLLIALAVLVFGYGGFQMLFPSVILHYRLTVEVEDNGVHRTGSSVIGLAFQYQGPIRTSETHVWLADTRGEAVAVDLGARGILFVLLTGVPYPSGSPYERNNPLAFYFRDRLPDGPPDGLAGKRALESFAHDRPKADIAPDKLPMLVRFRDIADPKTVERVDPNDLAKSFGPGVKLLRATIEITDEPVTTGIEKILPWLAIGPPGKRLVAATGGPLGEVSPEHRLTYLDFQRIAK